MGRLDEAGGNIDLKALTLQMEGLYKPRRVAVRLSSFPLLSLEVALGEASDIPGFGAPRPGALSVLAPGGQDTRQR